MPPEAFGPGSRVGPEMDIYCAGLTIFEMVNGPIDYTTLAGAPALARLSRGQCGIPDSALEFSPPRSGMSGASDVARVGAGSGHSS